MAFLRQFRLESLMVDQRMKLKFRIDGAELGSLQSLRVNPFRVSSRKSIPRQIRHKVSNVAKLVPRYRGGDDPKLIPDVSWLSNSN